MTRHTATIALLAVAAALPPATSDAGGFVGVRVGGDGFGLSFGAGAWAPYHDSWRDPAWSIDFDVTLGGYGEWLYVDGLGRVWRPWVAASWRPYTHGRWVSTAAGWTWISYEPWGYVPHHYGEWALTRHGWVWVPGWQYRPANVVWVRHGGWVGWYPCAPRGWSHHDRGFRHGYRHGFRDGYRRGYDDGYLDGWYDARHATWTRWGHLGADDLSHHAGAPPDLGSAVARGRVTVLERGPSRDDIRRSGVRVPEARLEHRSLTMQGRRVEMARPVGFDDTVRRHADDTVRRAMPQLVERDRQPRIDPTPERDRGVRPRTTEMPVPRPRGDSRSTAPPKPRAPQPPSMGQMRPETPRRLPDSRELRSPVPRRPVADPPGVRRPDSIRYRPPGSAGIPSTTRRAAPAAPPRHPDPRSMRAPARSERPAPSTRRAPEARSERPAPSTRRAPGVRSSDARARGADRDDLRRGSSRSRAARSAERDRS